MDAPQYSLKPSMDRFILPRAVLILILGITFFFGIYLNLVLLKMKVGVIHFVIIAVIVLIIAGLAIAQRVSDYNALQYNFYTDRIYIGTNPVMLKDVSNLNLKQDLIDKAFNTCTIELAPVAKLSSIPNSYQIFTYVQQLLKFNHKF